MFRALKLFALMTLNVALSVQAQEPRLQDPMRPPVAAGTASGAPEVDEGLKLTAVLVSDSRRIAVINGRFYRVGDQVNGEEITRIEPGSIRIKRGSEQVLITVKNGRRATTDQDGDQDQ